MCNSIIKVLKLKKKEKIQLFRNLSLYDAVIQLVQVSEEKFPPASGTFADLRTDGKCYTDKCCDAFHPLWRQFFKADEIRDDFNNI